MTSNSHNEVGHVSELVEASNSNFDFLRGNAEEIGAKDIASLNIGVLNRDWT